MTVESRAKRCPRVSRRAYGWRWGTRTGAARVITILIVLASGMIYLRSLGNGWVNYDDPVFVLAEPVKSGLSSEGVLWALTSREQQNWIPVTRLVWLAQWELFGASPAARHSLSLLLHMTAVGLAAWAWRRHTGSAGAGLCAAAVFALHPLQVEAVAWATAQKDLLAGVAALAALGWSSGARVRPWWALMAFVLSLLAKQSAVLLPVYLLLASRGPLRHRVACHWLLVPAAAAGVVAALWGGAAAPSPDQSNQSQLISLAHAPMAYIKYLFAFLWPDGLCYAHPLPAKAPWFAGATAAAGLLGFSWYLWRKFGKSSSGAVWCGWLWFLLLFLPSSGIICFGPQAWAERFGYLALCGLGAALWTPLQYVTDKVRSLPRVPPWAVPALAVGVCVVWASCTWRQQRFWNNSESLFRRAIEVEQPSALPHFHLAIALEDADRRREADQELQRALSLDAEFWPARYNLACSFMAQSRFRDALHLIRPVVSARPHWSEAHLVLANALYETGDPVSALHHYEEAARLKPALPTAAQNASTLRRTLTKTDTAPSNGQ